MLHEQKTSCDAMVDEKNSLIDDLQQVSMTKRAVYDYNSVYYIFPGKFMVEYNEIIYFLGVERKR